MKKIVSHVSCMIKVSSAPLLTCLLISSTFLFTGVPTHHTNDKLDIDIAIAAAENWMQYSTADVYPNTAAEQKEFQVDNKTTVNSIASLQDEGLFDADKLVLHTNLYCPYGPYYTQNLKDQYIIYENENRSINLQEIVEEKKQSTHSYKKTLSDKTDFWQDLINDCISTEERNINMGTLPDIMELDLTTRWHQGAPYNKKCPESIGECPEGEGRCAVGCTGLAMAHVMKYWNWPPAGIDEYSDPYDWQNISNKYINLSGNWVDENGNPLTEDHIEAVAELCYEVGESIDTRYCIYNSCMSGAYLSGVNSALEKFFLYHQDTNYISFKSEEEIIDIVTDEIKWFRPVLMTGVNSDGIGHTWVIYGYDDTYDPPKFLMNQGRYNYPEWNHVWWSLNDEEFEFKYNLALSIYIAPENVRFAKHWKWWDFGPIDRDGSPNNPYLFLNEAIDNTPDGGTLVLKAGSFMTPWFDEWNNDLMINKPITIIGHEAIIQTRAPRNRAISYLNWYSFLERFPVLQQLLNRFGK